MSTETTPDTPRPRRRFSFHRQHDPRPPATAPGALVHVGERRVNEVTFRVIDYSPEEVKELHSTSVPACVEFEGRDSPAWIMVTGLHDVAKIGELLEAYSIHPLVQDDILNTNQQPKMEDFGTYLFITAKQLTETGPDCVEPYDLQHFSLILTERVLITFHEAPSEVFAPVLQRLKDGKGKLRTRGPDYLMWALLDAILDYYLEALGHLDEKVAAHDEELTRPNPSITLSDIHTLRAATHFLYRIVRPMRELVVSLQHCESDLLTPPLTPFLRDLYDHSWHAIENADHLREAVTAMREYHQAILAQRMNEVMKVLTALSTVFLPLTFLAGVYGMNFEYQPEYHWYHGYAFVWTVFIVVTLLTLWFFRRRKWL
jgi:magnesium transporter